MQPRATRFWLRIETGARSGERVALPDGSASLGRRSDCTVVLGDASVSGHHAEVRVEGERVVLQDLGSTNGTKVRGEKVQTAELAHGASFQVGAVRLTLLDGTRDAGDAAEGIEIEGLEPLAPVASARDEVAVVKAEQVARAGSRSRLAPLVLVLIVLAGAAAAWSSWSWRVRTVTAPTAAAVPGDLLGDASFESGDGGFTSADAAPQGFLRDAGHAHRGRFGLGAALGPGEWAFARSKAFALPSRGRIDVRASLAADPGTLARLGLELSAADGKHETRTIWKEALAPGAGFSEVELSCDAWGGFDRGCVCLAALAGESGGTVAADDVSAVPADEARGPAATFNEFAVYSTGSAAFVVRSGSVLLGPIEFGDWSERGLAGPAQATWTARATPAGFALVSSATPPGAVCRIVGPRGTAGGEAVRVASLGPEGYRLHASEFERPAATAALLGDGLDLVEVSCAQPATLRGSVQEGVPVLALELGEEGELEVQLSFREERAEAALLETKARAAEAQGRYGEALAAWSELLDRVPFEARLVEEASNERAKRLQAGLEAIAGMRSDFERARFFELADLYRQIRARTTALGATYAGSEVEFESGALVREIDGALEAFGAEDGVERRRRLAGVLSALDPSRSPALSALVRSGLEPVEEEP